MNAWQDWIGREERRSDRVDPALYARWLATLDRASANSDFAAQGFHWCLCTPDAPTRRLGGDGHLLRDDGPTSFLPPIPLPRRMWASSKIEFIRPLRLGAAVRRRSRVLNISEKTGGSGPLSFVEIEHLTLNEGEEAIREVQSLVYREAAEPGSQPAPPPQGGSPFDCTAWPVHRLIIPGEVLLFRFSALTFNSHRIHYDAPYAVGQENYRGLVVHGPLTATLLLDLARRELGDNALGSFSFRGHSPAICGEELHLTMRPAKSGYDLAAHDGHGRLVMSASAAI